eukprot:scaffold30514_cov73-Cyclotella_meneghiniana.AAC.3
MTKNTSRRRRKSSCIYVLITVSCSHSLPYALASSSPRGNRNIESIQRLSNREEPVTTSSSSSHITRDAATEETHISSSSNARTVNNEDTSISPLSNISTSNKKKHSSISINTTGIFSILQNIIANSSKPLLQTVTFTAQLAVAVYLTKVSWKVVKEVWDELNEEYANHYKSEDVREEQDLPFVDSNSVTDLDVDGDGAADDALFKKGSRGNAHQKTSMRNLASRLRSAGIPYASEVDEGESRTIESVIKSLTRSEGNVLSQTLLTPNEDASFNHQDPASTAAKAWNAIGGLAHAKESLLDLAFPLLPSSIESNNYYGGLLANPPGVLLYGPPGCGKSMLVRALSSTVGARFLVVSPSCLLRKYVGETNLNVRALFSVATKISPCIIFVDELDGLFRERGGEDHDVSRDLKTEFLQLWDGIRHNHLQGGGIGSESSSVLVIGATNRPFDVDPAFLRRMPRRIFIGLPDLDARVAVLKNMLHGVPLDPSFDADLIARQTRGYSSSDLREVLQAAALFPLREARAAAINFQKEGQETNQYSLSLRKLKTEDVLKALDVAKPTHFSKKYERDLMEYVQQSGGTRDSTPTDDNHSPHVSEGLTFSSEYYNNEEQEDSDSYSYDESESDDEL